LEWNGNKVGHIQWPKLVDMCEFIVVTAAVVYTVDVVVVIIVGGTFVNWKENEWNALKCYAVCGGLQLTIEWTVSESNRIDGVPVNRKTIRNQWATPTFYSNGRREMYAKCKIIWLIKWKLLNSRENVRHDDMTMWDESATFTWSDISPIRHHDLWFFF